MKKAALGTLGVAVCLFVAWPAAGAGGATPIWEPTTIVAPGKYVVTRNITHPGTVIEIASDDVHLDLNGFTLENSTTFNRVIYCNGVEGVTIENGTVLGGGVGISIYGKDVEVRRVKIASVYEGISIVGYNITVEQNRIRDAAVAGISIDVCRGCRISSNRISGTDFGGGGSRTLGYGVIVDASLSGSEIADNIISECGDSGLYLGGYGNSIRDNTVRNCLLDGIRVLWGSSNHIEGNVLSDNAYGLWLGCSNTVYRGNTSRDNTTSDFSDLGTNNTSHGDNYMPNMM